jgi:hypothetical protein
MVHFLILTCFFWGAVAQAAYIGQSDLTLNGTSPSSTNPLQVKLILDDSAGMSASWRPDAVTKVQIDPTTLLHDTFETLNTNDIWILGGTTAPVVQAGSSVFAPGATANASSYMRTKATFAPGSSAYLQFASLIQLDTAALAGNKRIWGYGNYAATPTAATPITDGAVYELDQVTGALQGAVYSGGVRTQTLPLNRPTDGKLHRYAMYYKASRVYYELDNVQVGAITYPSPQIGTFGVVIGSFNGTAATTASPALSAALIGVGDTAKNSVQLSDGTFPWRKAKVSPAGAIQVEASGGAATYSAAVTTLATANSPTDVFSISGSATKVVKVRALSFSCTQSTSTYQDLLFLKRSTANGPATGTYGTAVPLDSANPAATAVIRAYTSNPSSLGTLVGVLRSERVAFTAETIQGTLNNNTAPATNVRSFLWEPGTNSQPVTLRGTSEVAAINMNSNSANGSKCNAWIEWTEE